MFNKNSTWEKEIEKPRLAILTLLTPSLIAIVIVSISTTYKSSFDFYLQIGVVCISLFLAYFIINLIMRNKNFIKISKTIDTQIDLIQKKRTKSTFSGIMNTKDISKINIIYNHLVDNNLINDDLTTKNDFKNILSKQESNSNLYLMMDNPTARDFFDCLKEVFPDIKNNSRTSFFENYGKVYRIDKGKIKTYNASQVSNSKQRTKESKYFQLFKSISTELNQTNTNYV